MYLEMNATMDVYISSDSGTLSCVLNNGPLVVNTVLLSIINTGHAFLIVVHFHSRGEYSSVKRY